MKRGLLILLLLWSGSVFTQELILHSVSDDDSVDIIETVQQFDGAIWYISKSNLYRYDGFSISVKATIPETSDRFTTLATHHNTVYMGTKNGSLYCFQSDSLSKKPIDIKGRITNIANLDDTSLLIFSHGSGLYTYDIDTQEHEKLGNHPDLNYTNDAVVVNGEILVATDRGLLLAAASDPQFIKDPNYDSMIITNIFQDGDSVIWFSEFKNTIHRYNHITNHSTSHTINVSSRINDITFHNDLLYVSLKQGLYHSVVDDSSSHLNLILDKQGSIFSTMLDDENNIWVAAKNGLYHAPLKFARWNFDQAGKIHAIVKVKNNLYLGTETGLMVFDLKTQRLLPLEGDYNVTCMDASKDHLVVGTYDSGLYITTLEADAPIALERVDDFTSQTILALQVISRDSIVVSTLSGTHIITLNNGKWQSAKKIVELDQHYILCIYVTKERDIWFGTDKNGCIQYADDNIHYYEFDSRGEKINSIYSFTEEDNGNIWAVSNKNGLLQIADGLVTPIDHPMDKSWGKYTSMVSLGSNSLMLIGINEIGVYNTITNNLSVLNSELQWRHGESFLNNYFADDTEALFEHNNYIYLAAKGHDNGRMQPAISLHDIQVNLESINTTIHQFKESDNDFAFFFSGIYLSNPQSIGYSYILENYDSGWRTTKDRAVSYPHLPPGEYTFKVRSSHLPFANDKALQSSYTFSIHQAIYNTWWFRLLSLLIIALLLYLWRRKNHLEKEEKELLKFQKTEAQLSHLKSQLNPHFLFNSFNTMIGLIEEDTDRSIEFILHLTDFYRLVLETGEDELITIDKELELLLAYKHLLEERFDKGLTIDIQATWPKILIPPMSLQILVENAIKHNITSESSPLDITISSKDDLILVKNNLNLKTTSEPSFGIGLKNLEKRFTLISGKGIGRIEDENYITITLPMIRE